MDTGANASYVSQSYIDNLEIRELPEVTIRKN